MELIVFKSVVLLVTVNQVYSSKFLQDNKAIDGKSRVIRAAEPQDLPSNEEQANTNSAQPSGPPDQSNAKKANESDTFNKRDNPQGADQTESTGTSRMTRAVDAESNSSASSPKSDHDNSQPQGTEAPGQKTGDASCHDHSTHQNTDTTEV